MDKRQVYYKALEQMFESPGWKILLEDVEDQLSSIQANYGKVHDLLGLGRLQGREMVFMEFKTLEDNVRAHQDALNSEESENASV